MMIGANILVEELSLGSGLLRGEKNFTISCNATKFDVYSRNFVNAQKFEWNTV